MRVPNSRSRHKDITVKSNHLKILFGIILAFFSLKERESPSTLLDFVIKIALVRNTVRFLSAVYFRKAPRLARQLRITWSSILEHVGSATPHIGGASGGDHNCKFCIDEYRKGPMDCLVQPLKLEGYGEFQMGTAVFNKTSRNVDF